MDSGAIFDNLNKDIAEYSNYGKIILSGDFNCRTGEQADHIINLVVSLPQKKCVAYETGSGYAADSKLSYTIQFSILMLCAKYQEAGLCGS